MSRNTISAWERDATLPGDSATVKDAAKVLQLASTDKDALLKAYDAALSLKRTLAAGQRSPGSLVVTYRARRDPAKFGKLLAGAAASAALLLQTTQADVLQMILDSLPTPGEETRGLNLALLERWCHGQQEAPPAPVYVAALVQFCVRYTGVDALWIEAFAASAGLPKDHVEALLTGIRTDAGGADLQALRSACAPYLALQRQTVEECRLLYPRDPQQNLLGFYIHSRGSTEPPTRKAALDGAVETLWSQMAPALLAGKPCFLLGDFGTGKTWFLQHLLYRLAENTDNPRWIPLLYRLRAFRPQAAAGSLFDTLRGQPATPFAQLRRLAWIAAFGEGTVAQQEAALLKLYEQGRFLILFDGLDEAAGASRAEVDQIITDIGRVAATPYRSPVLVACRRNFLDDMAQEYSLRQRGFEVFHLWPWSTDDIRLYLAKAYDIGLLPLRPEVAYERLQSVYDLRDLASRALLAAMLLDQWDEILPGGEEAAEKQNLLELYEGHVEKAILNWQAQKTLRLQPHQIRRYMEELAYLMFELDSLQIRPDELDQYFERSFGVSSVGRYSEIASSLVRDIKTNALLVRDGNDYAFCHASIWEFFLARRLLRGLEAGDLETFKLLGRAAQYASVMRNFVIPTLKRDGKIHLLNQVLQGSKPANSSQMPG